MGNLIQCDDIGSLIRTIRGRRVILDFDLARIYGVPTRRLNEQIKRNATRFPADFLFQLTTDEAETLVLMRSQFATAHGANFDAVPHSAGLPSNRRQDHRFDGLHIVWPEVSIWSLHHPWD